MEKAHILVSLSDLVFLPDSKEYKASTNSYFTAFENEINPLCVAQPRDVKELSQLLQKVSEISDLSVAVRGGGHTPWAGAANVEGGITVDLLHFKGIEVDTKAGLVHIGARETWGDVYGKLAEHSLGVSGGRVSRVAVSGLTLGGGLSDHSRKTGFVCDSVKNFEVVLASGEVVQANADNNSDLFVALKGGSNNFGIVTKYTFPTFHQGSMWGGIIAFPATTWPTIVDKFYDYSVSTDGDDQNCAIIAACAHFAQFTGCTLNLYSTDSGKVSQNLKDMAAIQPQLFGTIREDSKLNLALEISNMSQDGTRQWYFTTTFKLSKEFMLKAQPIYTTACEAATEKIPGFGLAMTLQPITVDQLQASVNHGPNSLGLSPADGQLVNLLLNSMHANKEDDDAVLETVNGLLEKLNILAADIGVAHRYRFMNYAYKDTPVIAGYGDESLKNMWAVSKKYDPEGFFQKRVPGGFKLPQTA